MSAKMDQLTTAQEKLEAQRRHVAEVAHVRDMMSSWGDLTLTLTKKSVGVTQKDTVDVPGDIKRVIADALKQEEETRRAKEAEIVASIEGMLK